ncbi:MAG: ribosome silencing factor [Sphaerochaetaceae bacterium]|jgi:ribosome-associated protein|nr:ribosome silencing factor [Sphaerochaetaceae bacterium]
MLDDDVKQVAAKLAAFIADHKGADPVILDVSETSGWADCFIIATVNSLGHLRGLARELWGYLAELGVEVLNRHKNVGSDGWELIDCNSIVIHLMSAEMRSFYALEKLWHNPVGIQEERQTIKK